MSRPRKRGEGSSLGNALLRDALRKRAARKTNVQIVSGARGEQFLHSAALDDGSDWNHLNLRSVTEAGPIEDFLAVAELANADFTAERQNITLVTPSSILQGILREQTLSSKGMELHREKMRIPRRPKWDEGTTPEALAEAEKASFLEWRRSLALLAEEEGVLVTPFEKNLEVWRQLWRVVERSDVIVQILDCRNPLLYRCEDLEKYVHEIGPKKMSVLLLNKSDYLTEKQRSSWAAWFQKQGVRVFFYSATTDSSLEEGKMEPLEAEEGCAIQANPTDQEFVNSSRCLSPEELVSILESLHVSEKFQPGLTTIGLVGYPNVGKSSTINSLMKAKKVATSATPGKTKHFQTLYLSRTLLLCDCPGLVFPSFVSTKSDLVLGGVLPIDNLRDHRSPIALLLLRIPRQILEHTYGISIPQYSDEIEGERNFIAPEELLDAYGKMRGYMTHRGLPDNPRSARYILKDFVNGRLLYCHAPPEEAQDVYHQVPLLGSDGEEKNVLKLQDVGDVIHASPDQIDLDRAFFAQAHISKHHIKGRIGVTETRLGFESNASISSSMTSINSSSVDAKPWRRHNNKNKREKLRRVYKHLDA